MRRSKSAGGWLCVLRADGCDISGHRVAGAGPGFDGSESRCPDVDRGFDFANAYFFRGIFQDDTGVVMALRRSRLRAALRR